MDSPSDTPSSSITQGNILYHHWHKLGTEINVLLASEEAHIKEIAQLKSELSAYKQAWNSLDRSKRSNEEDFQRQLSLLEKEKRELETQITALKGTERRVVCLIDGDGTIFEQKLIEQGEHGGFLAAQTLTKYTQDYLLSKHGFDQFQLWTYVFFNKRGLLEALGRAGLGQHSKSFNEFIIGFNQAAERFCMVDVGSGKEMADAKIKTHLDDNIRLPQTAKIIFGGCHDNGYVATLRSFITDGYHDKLILLPGYTEMAVGIKELCLPAMTTFELFMPEKLTVPVTAPSSAGFLGPDYSGGIYAQSSAVSSNTTISASSFPSGLGRVGSPTNVLMPRIQGPVPTYSLALQSVHSVPAQRSLSSPSESGTSISAESNNDRFTKGLINAARRHVNPNIPLSKHKPPPCTLHYLATCKHESDCKYGHDYLLKEEHYEEIRKNAKKAPCPSLNKDEECLWGDKCIYGHKCPEGVNCHFRLQGRCRFGGAQMHVA